MKRVRMRAERRGRMRNLEPKKERFLGVRVWWEGRGGVKCILVSSQLFFSQCIEISKYHI